MIPIFWQTRSEIPNLTWLQSQVDQFGGAIVQYQRVLSLVVYSQMTPVFEWVSPTTSRTSAGMKHTLFSALLGWWSLAGFFWTPSVLLGNLMGGVNVTAVLTGPEKSEEELLASPAYREFQQNEKRQRAVFVVYLLCLLGITGWFAVRAIMIA